MIVNRLQVIDSVKIWDDAQIMAELDGKVTAIFLQNLIFLVIFVQYF